MNPFLVILIVAIVTFVLLQLGAAWWAIVIVAGVMAGLLTNGFRKRGEAG